MPRGEDRFISCISLPRYPKLQHKAQCTKHHHPYHHPPKPLSSPRNSHILPSISPLRPNTNTTTSSSSRLCTTPRLPHLFRSSPTEQPGSAEDKSPNDNLVFPTVALDTSGEDLTNTATTTTGFGGRGTAAAGVFADGEVLREAEGVRALRAGGLGAELD